MSSTEKLLRQLLDALAERAVEGEIVPVVDFNIKPGAGPDEVERYARPDLRRRIHARQDSSALIYRPASDHSAACWASWLTAAFASSVKASSVFFSSSNVSSRNSRPVADQAAAPML